MTKRNSRRALLPLLISVMLIACSDSIEDHQQKATQYLAQGDKFAAVIELKNAVQKAPDMAQLRYELGKAYLLQGNYDGAEKELSRALSLEQSNLDYLSALAQNYLEAQRYDEIAPLLAQYAPSVEGQNAQLLGIRALAALFTQEPKQLQRILAQAKQFDFTHPYLQAAQAASTLLEEDNTQAQNTLTDVLKENNDDPQLWLLSAFIYSKHKHIDKASEAHQQSAKLRPLDLRRQILLAQILLQNQEFTKAERTISRLIQALPGHYMLNIFKAQIDFRNQDFDGAYRHARTALNNGPEHLATRLIAGASAFQLKQYEQALPELNRILKLDPNHLAARRLLLATQLHLGELNYVMDNLGSFAVTTKEEAKFAAQFGNTLIGLGHEEIGQALLSRSAISGDRHSQLRADLLQLTNGDEASYQRIAEHAPKVPNDLVYQFAYAYALGQRNKFNEIIALSNRSLKLSPSNQPMLHMKAQAHLRLGHYEDAQRTYTRLLEYYPDDLLAQLGQNHLQFLSGKQDAAFDMLYRLKEQYPQSEAIAKSLLGYALALQRASDYLDLVIKQQQQNPSDANLQAQLANAYFANTKLSEGLAILEAIPASERNEAQWKQLGEAHFQLNQLDKAQQYFREWINYHPLSRNAYNANLGLLYLTRQFEPALSLAERGLSIFPNDLRFSLVKAQIYQAQGQLDKAMNFVNSLPETLHSKPEVVLLKGLIAFEQENWKSANTHLSLAFELRPSEQAARYNYTSLIKLGQQDEAQLFLQRALNQHSDKLRGLNRQLIEAELNQKPQQAIARYLHLLKTSPQNSAILNNLAWAYFNANETNKAVSYAQKAYDLDPQRVEIIDTYGYMLMRAEQLEKALSLLAKAHQLAPQNMEIRLHYAEALIIGGDSSQAKTLLNSLNNLNAKQRSTQQQLQAKLK